MKVKDLIKQLQQLPPDQRISVNGWDDFHIEWKFYAYDEDLKEECWHSEMDFNYIMKNRDKFPEKMRYSFHENDEFYKNLD